jgi:CRP-like cAMP-binding protein
LRKATSLIIQIASNANAAHKFSLVSGRWAKKLFAKIVAMQSGKLLLRQTRLAKTRQMLAQRQITMLNKILEKTRFAKASQMLAQRQIIMQSRILQQI